MSADFTAEDFSGLADKIDTLDLTSREEAILDAILERAASSDEVSGFAGTPEFKNPWPSAANKSWPPTGNAKKLMVGLGFEMPMPEW